MSNKKQTAVEWMITCINARIDLTTLRYWDEIQSIVNDAKEMEYEQMGGAFISGGLNWETPLTFSEYYRQTYGDHLPDVRKTIGGQDESKQ
mgnify:CR=1 FL=1